MDSFKHLADRHRADDAGNPVACTCVDFREPPEWFLIPALQEASARGGPGPGGLAARAMLTPFATPSRTGCGRRLRPGS
ncbi:MAG: hypothetical protein F4X11_18295 [Acidobacteria bacterium]|nr:hypothetical protein [Acidobacteriota bacterium]